MYPAREDVELEDTIAFVCGDGWSIARNANFKVGFGDSTIVVQKIITDVRSKDDVQMQAFVILDDD